MHAAAMTEIPECHSESLRDNTVVEYVISPRHAAYEYAQLRQTRQDDGWIRWSALIGHRRATLWRCRYR